MFESRISAGATEKLPCSENLRISSWSFDTRIRLESSLPKDHEDHMAEKGFNSLSHHDLMHKNLFPCLKRKKSGCESSSGQRV